MATKRISLDGTWRFQVEGEAEERTIPVPGPWEAAFPHLRDRPVTATYTRAVKVPRDWNRGVVRLHVGAADYYAEVSVNGYLVGVHEGGYTPFDLEVQEFLRPGEENTVAIKVADGAPARMVTGEGDLTPVKSAPQALRPFPFTEIPHGKQSWYATVGGIWQSVWLEQRPDCYIDNVFVRPDVPCQGASVRVRLQHPPLDPAGHALRLTVTLPKGAASVPPVDLPLPGARQGVVNLALSIPEPALWEPETPHLYGLRVELVRDGRAVDSFDTRFGMRQIEAREGQILLNGRPIFLSGVLDQDYYPDTIYTPPSTAYLRDQLQKAKDMGLNLLRCHIKTPDPRYLDLCDEMGLIVWYEIPNWAVLTKKSAKRGREHLEAMLERDYNHASLLILSIMNESWGIDLSEKWQREWLVEMFDYAKALDPTRLVVDNSACEGNFHVKSDIDDYHVYFSVPDHANRWADWCADFASRPRWTYTRYGDAQRTFKEPIVLSEFGNWGLPKISSLKKCYGGEEPWWFATGAGAARPEGVLQRFAQFHLDQVFGTYDKLAEASQWQQWLSLKYEIEEMRKHSSIVGYVVTELTDLHWESNGLLDMCRNPKVFHERLPQLLGQDLLIPDHTRKTRRVAYWGGERFQLPVQLSHFSRRDLAGATVYWEVDGFGDLKGQLPIAGAPPVGTSALGEIAFRVPHVPEARPVTVRLRLVDRQGREVTRNEEAFSWFPASARQIDLRPAVYVHDPSGILPNARAVLREAGVRLAESLEAGVVCLAGAMDDKLLHFVHRGGAALLLALERESLPRTTSGLASVGRDKNGWWGDWASGLNWFKPEGARPGGPWASLPQTAQFDFTYQNVTPKRVLVGFDPDRDFEDIWAGLFLGWIHFPAAFAGGFRYGDGKVLATTFDLLRHAGRDPVGVVMLGDLLRFVASDRFVPKKTVEMTRVELSHTLVKTAEEGGTEWRYSTEAPPANWTRPGFDDRTWKTGRSGFGRGLSQATSRTRWSAADIWLRLDLDVPAEGMAAASLRYFHDDDLEVFVNGEPLLTRQGYTGDYEDLSLAPDQVALFTPGRNVVCVHCRNHDGPQYVDIGITYEPGSVPQAPRGPAPPAEAEGNVAASPLEMARHGEKVLQTTGS